MVMGLVSRLSLANYSDSESFLVVHALSSQDGCQWERFWEVVEHVMSLFDLSWALPVGGGLLVPCFFTRTSCRKTTHANSYYGAWPGWVVSVNVLPLIKIQDCQGKVRVGFVTIILARPPPWKKLLLLETCRGWWLNIKIQWITSRRFMDY